MMRNTVRDKIFSKLLVGAVVLVTTVFVHVEQPGQASVLEDVSTGFAFHAGGFSPLTLGKPLAVAPLPIQELLVTSLVPPSRPTERMHKASVHEGKPVNTKQRLGLALLLLGMLAEEQ